MGFDAEIHLQSLTTLKHALRIYEETGIVCDGFGLMPQFMVGNFHAFMTASAETIMSRLDEGICMTNTKDHVVYGSTAHLPCERFVP